MRTGLPLKWVRDLPPLTPAYRDVRLQFDAGYEPIGFGKRIFVGSSHDNSITAFDADSGVQLWKFYTNGPIRFAPVGGKGRIVFGSDDGWVYCLSAPDGDMVWKFQAVPSERKLIGNDRLISVWPIRGGPVLKDDRVYFAAGVWPLEGVFIYCLEAESGKVVWLNDRSSYIYGKHPHNTEAFGGVAPQGYLLIDGGDLVVPCGNAYPARFDLKTGDLKEFELPSPGRLTGGWFTATLPDKDARRGLVFDEAVNQKRHEDRLRMEGDSGIRNKIALQRQDIPFAGGYPGVEGTIYSGIASDGNLVLSTKEGKLYCFGETSEAPTRHPLDPVEKAPPPDSPALTKILNTVGARKGYAVVLSEEPYLAEELADRTEMRVIAVTPIEVSKRRSDLGSARLSYRTDSAKDYEMPPYFANTIILDSEATPDQMQELYDSVRPYGGALVLTNADPDAIRAIDFPGGEIESLSPEVTLVRRNGALPGSTNYLGDWNPSPDALVKAPMGVLWFGDQVSHFKRAPQPRFIDGVMVSADKDWTDASRRSAKNDYRLLEPQFTDVYTGRPFDKDEAPELRRSFPAVDPEIIQPSQYRPPGQPIHQNNPESGTRINPLTGKSEPRKFFKMYGCDGGLSYGNFYTFRSGTAAFYDMKSESGTINISGPRSGCTNSVIPANGLLNVPYFYEGCTCSYPLPMALSLVSMPETFEQWMAWGAIPAAQLHGKIERLGINLGAPGDRKTEDGTLWLDYPSVGGPTPEIVVTTLPANPKFTYRHSIWMTPDEKTWPWVAASAATDIQSITIAGFKPGAYQIKLTFAAFDPSSPSEFEVRIQGKAQTGSIRLEPATKPLKSFTRHYPDIAINHDLKLEFSNPATLSGIEIIPSDGLK
jgi:outer membrane protein assembly factor BamB